MPRLNNQPARRGFQFSKEVRLQKAMKPKALLGDQTFDPQLTQLRGMG